MANNNSEAKQGFIKRFYGKHPIISHLILICIVAFVALWMALLFLDIWTSHGSTAVIPNATNIDNRTAIEIFEKAGYKVEISDSVYDPRYEPGKVISIWPRPGAVVKPGREVYLTIASYQPRMVTINVPLVNVSSRQAIKDLESMKIKNVKIEHVPSQYPDLVLSAKYNGREIEQGMKLPVTAKVVLEVGVVPDVEDVDEEGKSLNGGYFDDSELPTTTFDDDEAGTL